MEDESIYQIRKTSIKKIEDNLTYHQSYQKMVSEVSYEDMTLLLKLFLDKAAVNMGKECYDAPDATKDSILEFLYREFKFLPVFYVGSAILKGSLDSQSTGRLIPKTVRKWLNDSAIEYRRNKDHRDMEDRMKETPIVFDLHKYPIGKAIAKKIDWYRSGILSINDWDKIPLKELAEMIRDGKYCSPELFGLNVSKDGQTALRETETVPDTEEDISEEDNGIFR